MSLKEKVTEMLKDAEDVQPSEVSVAWLPKLICSTTT
jgi:hypothetical protein